MTASGSDRRRCARVQAAASRQKRSPLFAMVAGILAASSAPVGAASASADQSPPWYVYQDSQSPENHGHWTNAIPADGWQMLRLDLADATAPAAGSTAIRIDITLSAPWCGLIVASAPGYWGDRPGDGFDLHGASALAFRARGLHGGERVRIKAAVAGDQPFGDSSLLPLDAGWIELTPQWQDFRIEVAERDLSRLVTPFVLIANDKHNPTRRLTIFLDDIRYERRG